MYDPLFFSAEFPFIGFLFLSQIAVISHIKEGESSFISPLKHFIVCFVDLWPCAGRNIFVGSMNQGKAAYHLIVRKQRDEVTVSISPSRACPSELASFTYRTLDTGSTIPEEHHRPWPNLQYTTLGDIQNLSCSRGFFFVCMFCLHHQLLCSKQCCGFST